MSARPAGQRASANGLVTGRAPGVPAPRAYQRPHPVIRKSSNGHLHLAIVVALVAASLIALAVPISNTNASSRRGSPAPVSAAGEGLVSALRGQAETVTSMIAPPTVPASIGGARNAPRLSAVPGAGLIPGPLLAAVSELAAGAAFSSPETQASLIVHRQGTVSFTVHEEGMAVRHTSSQFTVGQALAGLGIKISPYDTVKPSPQTRLTPGMHVYISYASYVRLIVNGEERIAYTQADTVGDFFAQQGIAVQPTDHVFPRLTDPVRSGMTVSVVAVRDNVEFTEDPIEYSTVYEYDPDIDEGRRLVVQPGSLGFVRREYRLRTVNGEVVSRELVSEVVVPPTDEVVALGTRVPPTPSPRPAPPVLALGFDGLNCVRTINVWATWYSAASAGGNGRTATGTEVYKGIVAVDPSVIPLGTRMYIPGYGYGLAADTGGGIRGYMIDLGYGPDDVVDWRTKTLDICILG